MFDLEDIENIIIGVEKHEGEFIAFLHYDSGNVQRHKEIWQEITDFVNAHACKERTVKKIYNKWLYLVQLAKLYQEYCELGYVDESPCPFQHRIWHLRYYS